MNNPSPTPATPCSSYRPTVKHGGKCLVCGMYPEAHTGVSPTPATDNPARCLFRTCRTLDEIELIMEFEDEFEISISDDDAERIKTLKDVVDYVHGRVSA